MPSLILTTKREGVTMENTMFKKLFSVGNGWMVSVVRNEASYGSSDGLYELGMWNTENNALRDVKIDGYLDMSDVLDLVNEAHKDAHGVYVKRLS